jgi:hypothetical protein
LMLAQVSERIPLVKDSSKLTSFASAEYKKFKASDVIGSLISLYDSKDVFVKEFQNIMGDRLLKKDFDFDKEVQTE